MKNRLFQGGAASRISSAAVAVVVGLLLIGAADSGPVDGGGPGRDSKAGASKAAAKAASAEPRKKRSGETPLVHVLEIEGMINAGTADYLVRGIKEATVEGADLVVLRLDTPGGALQATRTMVKVMLNSAIPIAVLVGPAGARAGSAGVFITMAAHVAAMAPGTNIGAAHPVVAGGKDPEKAGGKHMAKKIENDTLAFVEAIARSRGRNIKWARKAVKESAAVTATEAAKLKVVDLLAYTIPDLLQKIDGRKVKVRRTVITLYLKNARIVRKKMSLKQRVVSFLANPFIFMMLMTLGMLGILLEFYHPGSIFPGVFGGICLLLFLIAAQFLPINYGGLALIALGLILLGAEMFTPTFGILFAGGLVSIVVGSMLLIDSTDPALQLTLWIVLPSVGVLGLMCGIAVLLAKRAHSKKVVTGKEGLEGEIGEVRKALAPSGTVRIHGEQWNARCAQPVEAGELIRVVRVDGLMLFVEPVGSAGDLPKPSDS